MNGFFRFYKIVKYNIMYKKNITLIVKRKLINKNNYEDNCEDKDNKLMNQINNLHIIHKYNPFYIYNIYFYYNYLLLFLHKNRNAIFIFILFIFILLYLKR